MQQSLALSINYAALAPKEASVTELKKYFNRASCNVISIDVDPAIKTSSGIKYKELQFGFSDSQQVVFQIKATGDIFQVKLNNKPLPIKHQDNEAKAVIEIIDAMDAGRAKFQANLARTVIKPPTMKASIVSIEQQLTDQRDGLKEQIAQVRADMVKAQAVYQQKAVNDPIDVVNTVVVSPTGFNFTDMSKQAKQAEAVSLDAFLAGQVVKNGDTSKPYAVIEKGGSRYSLVRFDDKGSLVRAVVTKDKIKEYFANLNGGVNIAEQPAAPEPIAITGKELGEFPDTEEGKNALRSAVKDHLMAMRGEWVDCPIIGKKVEIRSRGIKETLARSGDPRKLKLLAGIKGIISGATGAKKEPNLKPEQKPDVVNYYHLKSIAKLEGVVMPLRLVIEEDETGLLHYDMVIDDSEIEKALLDSALPSLATLPDNYSGFCTKDNLTLSNVLDSVNGSRMVFNLFIEGEEPEYVIGGADSTMGRSDLSLSVDNRDNSIANTKDDNRFADTGYIAGSRKEMAASFIRNAGKDKKQLGVTDIDWLAIEENPREAEAVIVKANVIGEPDYEALVEGGMKTETAFLISKVYASIAPKPVTNSPKARKAYVRGIETLRKNLETMKEPKEVSDYLMNVVYPEMTQPQFTAEEIEELEPLKIEYKKKLTENTAYGKDFKELQSKIKKINNDAMERTVKEGDIYLSWNGLGDRFVGVVKHRYDTGSKAFQKTYYEAKRGRPDNLDWLEKKKPVKDASGDEQAQPKKPKFELFVSDSFERLGGRAITVDSTKALKEQFGLRDIQSGNWVLKDKASAEFHVKRSAEAFADLADVIGVADDKVSIGGRLAMAFGARGKSGARAHYEPVQRVINLTKMNGGGSLGHEWFHAFDNLLVEKMGLGVSGARDFLTENPDLAGSTPVAKAFASLVGAMTVGKSEIEVVIAYDKSDYDDQIKNQKWLSFAKRNYGISSFQDAVANLPKQSKKQSKEQTDRMLRMMAAHFGGLESTSMSATVVSNKTQFSINAQKLDALSSGKAYWALPLEMAARAFSSYLEDKLEQQGRKNDYLSNHANNAVNAYGIIDAKPFPEGEERERINAAFDALFAVIKQDNVLDSIIEKLDMDEVGEKESEALISDFDDGFAFGEPYLLEPDLIDEGFEV